ncbi:unnamed protein product [Amoebophrya sp. A120]|nr:unnamed protein product [Amoebophrya sp. A120]|eukprot:GSA120T00004575001.1
MARRPKLGSKKHPFLPCLRRRTAGFLTALYHTAPLIADMSPVWVFCVVNGFFAEGIQRPRERGFLARRDYSPEGMGSLWHLFFGDSETTRHSEDGKDHPRAEAAPDSMVREAGTNCAKEGMEEAGGCADGHESESMMFLEKAEPDKNQNAQDPGTEGTPAQPDKNLHSGSSKEEGKAKKADVPKIVVTEPPTPTSKEQKKSGVPAKPIASPDRHDRLAVVPSPTTQSRDQAAAAAKGTKYLQPPKPADHVNPHVEPGSENKREMKEYGALHALNVASAPPLAQSAEARLVAPVEGESRGSTSPEACFLSKRNSEAHSALLDKLNRLHAAAFGVEETQHVGKPDHHAPKLGDNVKAAWGETICKTPNSETQTLPHEDLKGVGEVAKEIFYTALLQEYQKHLMLTQTPDSGQAGAENVVRRKQASCAVPIVAVVPQKKVDADWQFHIVLGSAAERVLDENEFRKQQHTHGTGYSFLEHLHFCVEIMGTLKIGHPLEQGQISYGEHAGEVRILELHRGETLQDVPAQNNHAAFATVAGRLLLGEAKPLSNEGVVAPKLQEHLEYVLVGTNCIAHFDHVWAKTLKIGGSKPQTNDMRCKPYPDSSLMAELWEQVGSIVKDLREDPFWGGPGEGTATYKEGTEEKSRIKILEKVMKENLNNRNGFWHFGHHNELADLGWSPGPGESRKGTEMNAEDPSVVFTDWAGPQSGNVASYSYVSKCREREFGGNNLDTDALTQNLARRAAREIVAHTLMMGAQEQSTPQEKQASAGEGAEQESSAPKCVVPHIHGVIVEPKSLDGKRAEAVCILMDKGFEVTNGLLLPERSVSVESMPHYHIDSPHDFVTRMFQCLDRTRHLGIILGNVQPDAFRLMPSGVTALADFGSARTLLLKENPGEVHGLEVWQEIPSAKALAGPANFPFADPAALGTYVPKLNHGAELLAPADAENGEPLGAKLTRLCTHDAKLHPATDLYGLALTAFKLFGELPNDPLACVGRALAPDEAHLNADFHRGPAVDNILKRILAGEEKVKCYGGLAPSDFEFMGPEGSSAWPAGFAMLVRSVDRSFPHSGHASELQLRESVARVLKPLVFANPQTRVVHLEAGYDARMPAAGIKDDEKGAATREWDIEHNIAKLVKAVSVRETHNLHTRFEHMAEVLSRKLPENLDALFMDWKTFGAAWEKEEGDASKHFGHTTIWKKKNTPGDSAQSGPVEGLLKCVSVAPKPQDEGPHARITEQTSTMPVHVADFGAVASEFFIHFLLSERKEKDLSPAEHSCVPMVMQIVDKSYDEKCLLMEKVEPLSRDLDGLLLLAEPGVRVVDFATRMDTCLKRLSEFRVRHNNLGPDSLGIRWQGDGSSKTPQFVLLNFDHADVLAPVSQAGSSGPVTAAEEWEVVIGGNAKFPLKSAYADQSQRPGISVVIRAGGDGGTGSPQCAVRSPRLGADRFGLSITTLELFGSGNAARDSHLKCVVNPLEAPGEGRAPPKCFGKSTPLVLAPSEPPVLPAAPPESRWCLSAYDPHILFHEKEHDLDFGAKKLVERLVDEHQKKVENTIMERNKEVDDIFALILSPLVLPDPAWRTADAIDIAAGGGRDLAARAGLSEEERAFTQQKLRNLHVAGSNVATQQVTNNNSKLGS